MKQILIICVFFVVVLLAIVGCLYIFDVMTFDASMSIVLKFGAAIVLLGVCTALVKVLMGAKTESQD